MRSTEASRSGDMAVMVIVNRALQRFEGSAIMASAVCLMLALAPRSMPAQSLVIARAAAADSGNTLFIAEGRVRCVRMVSPQYPVGVAAGAQEVVLRVLIDKNGHVRPLYRISGRRDFELEALNAVRMWQYRPFMRDQQPITTATNIEVKFVPGVPAGFVTHPSE